MGKIILNEFNVRKALKNIKKRYGDFQEVRDPWAEAEDAYLMREKLPNGWERIERPDDSPLYRDPDFNEYTKDEYGNFTPVESGDMMEGEDDSQIPDDVQQDFIQWAMEEADNQRTMGGPKNAVALMWEYYFDDNDQALYDLIQFYKDARGIFTEPDSQDDVWVSEEVRRAVNAWGAYQNDQEEGDTQECGAQLCESYGIGYQGRFISKKPGWGPTFTSFPQDAKAFNTPDEAQAYIDENLPDFGASVVSLPLGDEDELSEEDTMMLKEAIKGLIREHFSSMGGMQQFMQRPQVQMPAGDIAEKEHMHHHKPEHAPNQKHSNGRTTKRAIVIKWLKDPNNAVNCAEIMRQLWNPSPEDEDTKRGEFYKKRDGAINKDSGARYSFSDEEINTLYRIKSNRS